MNNKYQTLINTIIISAFVSLLSWQTVNASSKQDLNFVVYDNLFYDFIPEQSQIEQLASGFKWAEGPVWSRSLNSLLFSDVATDKIYRWNEAKGLKVYLQPSGHEPDNLGSAWRGSNGLAIDNNDKLLLAQQSMRRLSRMNTSLSNPQSQFDVITTQYKGKSLNSPNDLVVHPSGDIYFTDPPYGLKGRENDPNRELAFFGVFRLSKDKPVSLINKSLEKPNDIAFSTDHKTLYVSNSQFGKSHIIAIQMDEHGNAKSERLFFDGSSLIPDGPGATDGLAVHPSGTIFASIPNGVGIISPAGKLLGKIALGQITNVAFNHDYSMLYITAPNRLLRIKLR